MNKLYFDADNLPPRVATPGGDGTNPHYRLDPVVDQVIRDGDDDLQSMIDAAEGSVNINNIIARYRQSGDPALLQQRSYMFGDLAVQEGSYQQLIMMANQMRQIYDGLSDEDRAKVGSFESFSRLMATEPEAVSPAAADGSIEIGGVKYVPQTQSGSFPQTPAENSSSDS